MGALATAVACGERITAPGACPTYCPDDQIVLLDTLLLSAVAQDSAFTGFVPAHRATTTYLATDPGGGGLTARAIMRFFTFGDSLRVAANDTVFTPVLGTDSFRIDVGMVRRAPTVQGIQLVLHRLPAGIDSTTTYADVDAYFADSTQIAVIAVSDTLSAGTLTATVPASAFPTFAADARVVAIGIRLVTATATYLDLGTLESNNAVVLTRYARIDSAGTTVTRQEGRLPATDTYVTSGTPAPPPGSLVIGGVPSSRVLLRLAVPGAILDSSTIVRATLVLLPQAAAIGATGDTLSLLATGITADFGAKSPLVPVPIDSVPLRRGRLAIGTADTIRLDVTDLLRGWSANPDQPRTVVIRAFPEGGTPGAVAIGGTAGLAGARLQVSWIPPVALGDR